MKSKTETIIKAMRILSAEIHSDDGVANAAIAEAADRLDELQQRNAELMAQVELLQSCLMEIKYRNAEIEMPAFMRTGQCLAEVKARAIEEAADCAAGLISDKYGIATSGAAFDILNHKTDVVLCVAEYANQVRRKAKVVE